jgi:phosphatidate cytidylyltransferase
VVTWPPARTDDQLRLRRPPAAPPAGPRPALRFPLDASADPTRIERPPVQPAPDPVTGPVDDAALDRAAHRRGARRADRATTAPCWARTTTISTRGHRSRPPRRAGATQTTTGSDDGFVEQLATDSGEVRVGALGDVDAEPSHEEYFGFDDMEARVEERTGDGAPVGVGPRWEADDDDWSAADAPAAVAPEGWSEEPWAEEAYDDGYEAPYEDGYDDGYGDGGGYGPVGGGADNGGRNMPVAIAVGAGLAALALVVLQIGPAATTLLVTAILAICAVEYFEVLRKVGWESARLVGLVAVVALPLAVYWRGLDAVPLVGFLVVATVLSWYLVGAGGADPRVLEGTGATLLGVFWIGGLGSAATAMLGLDDGRGLLLIAIIATVAYDVGGLFIGKAMGHRALSSASPNKTVEGLVGGMGCALLATIFLVVAGLGPWDGVGGALALGLSAACAAPLGDLCQSVLKRDLGVKDMGSLLPGHGGLLDRFDAMLFVLPTVLWLSLTLGPFGG